MVPGSGHVKPRKFNNYCGYVLLACADALPGGDTFLRPELDRRGWHAAAVVTVSLVGTARKMTVGQCASLSDHGWDVCSHGWEHIDHTLLGAEDLDAALALAYNQLVSWGFTKGARIFGAAIALDDTVRDAALVYFTAVTAGNPAHASASLPAGPTYAKQAGDDSNAWGNVTALLDSCVNAPGKVAVLNLHGFVESGAQNLETSRARMEAILAYIETKELNPINYSDLIDSVVPRYRFFADDFRSGDTSAWTGTRGSPAVSTTAALVGANGLLIDANGNSCLLDFTATQRLRVRFYVDTGTLAMSTNAYFILVMLRDAGVTVGRVTLRYNGTSFIIGGGVRNDAGSYEDTGWHVVAAGAHFVEFDATYSASGSFKLYIDGTLVETLTGIDCDTREPDNLRLGREASQGTITGNVYLDAFIGSIGANDLIGVERA